MRRTTRRASQSGQLDRTVAEGNGIDSALNSGMDGGLFFKAG
jgi:hypothetical protein